MNKAAPLQEYDINKCPGCGGEADNGHDREVPPNPYYCTKCEAAPSQEPCPTCDNGSKLPERGGWCLTCGRSKASPSQEIEMPKPIPNLTVSADWLAPSQEPFAWVKCNDESDVTFQKPVSEAGYIKLYTTPSDAAAQIAELKRTWLSPEAYEALMREREETLKQIAKLEEQLGNALEENTQLRTCVGSLKHEYEKQIAKLERKLNIAISTLTALRSDKFIDPLADALASQAIMRIHAIDKEGD